MEHQIITSMLIALKKLMSSWIHAELFLNNVMNKFCISSPPVLSWVHVAQSLVFCVL